jgi:hypothetical protein
MRANLFDLFFDPGIFFCLMRLKVFQLFPLGCFIRVQRVLAARCIGEQFVGGNARRIERHQHRGALDVFR